MKNRICLLAWTMIVLALTASQSLAQSIYEPYTFTTLAGNAGYGSADGIGSEARFNSPYSVAVDNAGNLYVADGWNPTIRKVTPMGVVTTVAGLYGGTVALDNAGNLYVAGGSTIRKVTPTGVVTTLAGLARSDDIGNPVVGSFGSVDGTGSAARFQWPSAVAVDSAGNVYVTDGPTIRKVTPAGVVTTLAGLARPDGRGGSADGMGSAARFGGNPGQTPGPTGLAVDSAGNVYVADTVNHTIRKVTPEGVVTTLAGLAGELGSGDGAGSAARFGRFWPDSGLSGMAVDSAGNVYVADGENNTIRKVTPVGVVTTLAGLASLDNRGNFVAGSVGNADGTGSGALFNWPSGVAVDSAGNIYVADSANNTIRKGYPAPRILSSGPGFGFNGGQFGFNLTGPAGRLVIVEASTDLVSWLPLWTNTFTFPAALNFSDPESGVSSHHSYRARLP